MKKILVPTDFSIYAGYAAELAAELARKTDATIYFLHVVNIPTYDGLLPFSESQNTPEGLGILKMVRKKFADLFSQPFLQGVKVVEAIQMSEVYESITEAAKKHEIDLIIMGTHGSSGPVSDYFVGSNTDKIVRRSYTPVVSVRERIAGVDVKRIVFAGDFNRDISEAFGKVKSFVSLFGARMELLHVATRSHFVTDKTMKPKMEEFARSQGLTNYGCTLYNAESIEAGINEFADEVDADLIATVTEGRKGLALLLNGSVTNELMKITPRPVLTVRL